MLGLIGKTLGRYQLLEQVGQGGMSSVFKALDLPAGKHVAVKILSPYIAHEQRFRARFAREIKLLRRMHHPNIVPVIDFGEAEGFTYIVMPYIGTGTLLDRLQQGPLDVQTGARVTAQLASALGTAHAMGVIHRDVKPSNVLLDQEGNALLSDFSFAHHQEASQNLTGSALIGTPAYMSPEQCRGDPIDARSDQYSFAIMLYQLCTGKLPFEADTPMAVALKHVNEPLPRPREVNPNLPEQVDAVLIRALAKDRDLRYASVAELNDEFQKAIAQGIEKKGRKTRTPIFDRSTQLYEKYQSVDGKGRPWYRRRTTATAAVVLGLLMCPLSAWAMSVLPGLNGTPGQGTPMVYVWTPTGLAATLAALQTANAPAEGTQVAPGHVDTVVAATMAAMGPVVDGPTTIPTATPTGWIWNPQPTPTPTRTLRSGETPPTATRTPAPSTSQPTATDEVQPTATSQPTDTIAPATNTPSAPTNAPQPTCWPPGHCKAPTPTP
ncbi:MAG TPA: protein kinase [Anaerolineales bacterium]|nr:protein kinase [Anaerolineales bacterium]